MGWCKYVRMLVAMFVCRWLLGGGGPFGIRRHRITVCKLQPVFSLPFVLSYVLLVGAHLLFSGQA